MASILNWIQADEKKASSKHANSYTHAIFSIFFGLLGSVGLGYLAAKHNIVNNNGIEVDTETMKGYEYIGYFFASYHVVMIICRTSVKGPEELYNQLWACNTGMALATVGIFLHRRVLVGAAVAVVSIDQCLWYIDCIFKLTTGKFKVGVAKYLDWPETPFVQKLFSWHHLWFLPVCIYYLRNTGNGTMPNGSLYLAMIGVFSMGLISRILTPRDLNINMCFECWQDVHVSLFHLCDNKAAFIYLPWLVILFNILMIIPWQLMLFLVRVRV